MMMGHKRFIDFKLLRVESKVARYICVLAGITLSSFKVETFLMLSDLRKVYCLNYHMLDAAFW